MSQLRWTSRVQTLVPVVSITLLLMGTDVATSQDRQESSDAGEPLRIQSEVTEAWRAYVIHGQGLTHQFESRWVDMLTGTVLETMEGERRNSAGSSLTILSEKSGKSASGCNPDYSFLLHVTRDGMWAIRSLDVQGSVIDAPIELLVPPATAMVGRYAPHIRNHALTSRGLILDGCWLPSLIQSPAFRWRRFEFIEEAGRRLLRADFTNRPDPAGSERLGDGSMFLDPQYAWLPVKARAKAHWGAGETGEVVEDYEYEIVPNTVPRIRHATLDWIGTSETGERTHHRRESFYSGWQISDASLSHTRLTAFGLPEPGPPARKGWLHLFWLMILNGLIGLLGIGIWIRNRRRPPN